MDAETTVLANLSDDILLKIFNMLDSNPHDWGSLACTCKKFSWLIRNVCYKNKCLKDISSDLTSGSELPSGWFSLYKIAVCCPGLLHSGVVLPPQKFSLRRSKCSRLDLDKPSSSKPPSAEVDDGQSLSERLHLAWGVWELSKEKGSKLLQSGFSGDILYISEWPGCVHIEKSSCRGYMLFRGIFKDFKGSQVWKNFVDGKRSAVDLKCACCTCTETWDLHSISCLRRGVWVSRGSRSGCEGFCM